MLDKLDEMLKFIFGTLPALIFGAGMIVCLVMSVIAFCHAKEGFSAVHTGCALLTLAGLFYSYFPAKRYIVHNTDQTTIKEYDPNDGVVGTYHDSPTMQKCWNSTLAIVLVALLALGCIVATAMLQAMHIPPFIIMVWVVWGFALLGV